jgi:hypothetical protein
MGGSHNLQAWGGLIYSVVHEGMTVDFNDMKTRPDILEDESKNETLARKNITRATV